MCGKRLALPLCIKDTLHSFLSVEIMKGHVCAPKTDSQSMVLMCNPLQSVNVLHWRLCYMFPFLKTGRFRFPRLSSLTGAMLNWTQHLSEIIVVRALDKYPGAFWGFCRRWMWHELQQFLETEETRKPGN